MNIHSRFPNPNLIKSNKIRHFKSSVRLEAARQNVAGDLSKSKLLFQITFMFSLYYEQIKYCNNS